MRGNKYKAFLLILFPEKNSQSYRVAIHPFDWSRHYFILSLALSLTYSTGQCKPEIFLFILSVEDGIESYRVAVYPFSSLNNYWQFCTGLNFASRSVESLTNRIEHYIARGQLGDAVKLLPSLSKYFENKDRDLSKTIMMIRYQYNRMKRKEMIDSQEQEGQIRAEAKVAWTILELLEQIKDDDPPRNHVN